MIAPIAVCIVIGCQAGVVGEEIPADKFLKQYSIAARELQQKYVVVRGSGVSGSLANPQGGTFRFNFDHENRKDVFNYGANKMRPGESLEIVECVKGPGVGFALSRSGKEEAYSVNWIDVDEKHRQKFKRGIEQYVLAPFAPFGNPLIEYLTDASVRELSAHRVESGGQPAVQVDFKNGPGPSFNSNTVVLLPEASWAIQSYVSYPGGFSPDKNPFRFEVGYNQPALGIPTPRSVRFTDGNKKTEVYEFGEFAFEPTNASEFSMESYQLPDLTKPAKGSLISGPWILLGIAVASGAGALIFRRMSLSTAR